MDKPAPRLLVVDDDPQFRRFIVTASEDQGYMSRGASCLEEFRDMCRTLEPGLVLVDLAMPEGDGVEVLRFLASENFDRSVVLISGHDIKVINSAQDLARRYGLRVIGTLQKPSSVDRLDALLRVNDGGSATLTSSNLSEAIETGALTCDFQPKIGLSGDLAKTSPEVEALVRWRHPQYGVLAPGEFLPLAEQNDLLGNLTREVASYSLNQLGIWRNAGLELSVAINVAPQLLTNLELPDEFADLAKAHGIDTSRIIIEITETGIMQDIVLAMDILTRFRLKGFRLSMDDFGTGFSSMIQLYRMPFSELKIDQSFVKDVGKSEEARVIVRALAELARQLGLSACAEGVENEAARDFVAECGFDKMQGFFLCPPVEADQISGFFGQHSSRKSKSRVGA